MACFAGTVWSGVKKQPSALPYGQQHHYLHQHLQWFQSTLINMHTYLLLYIYIYTYNDIVWLLCLYIHEEKKHIIYCMYNICEVWILPLPYWSSGVWTWDIPASLFVGSHMSAPMSERSPGSFRIYHIPWLSEGEVLRPLRFHECEMHTSGQSAHIQASFCLSSGEGSPKPSKDPRI
jgi:hypothetical protein